MALLTWQQTPIKGSSAQVSLNKSDLFNIPAVSGDAFFSIQSNVAKARVIFISTTGNQIKVLDFDLSQGSPSVSVPFSATSRSAFSVQKIILQDYDDGDLVLQGADIPSGLGISVL